jgi:hypothetical protein
LPDYLRELFHLFLSKRRALVSKRHFFCLVLLSFHAIRGGFAQYQQRGESPPVEGIVQSPKERVKPNCLKWKNEACTECGIDSAIDLSVKNKTKTPVLLCRNMKPGPVKVVMLTHAEPAIPGVWEVEFGLGYQTSTRVECPHQFIASNNLPLKTAYEVGPVTIEGEIPSDGMIQALVCVGLSSARVGGEGKETGASLRVFRLRVASE